MTRQIWIGNIPTDITEGQLILLFKDMKLPVPWKAVMRPAPSGLHQWAIATFETGDEARFILGQRLRWPNGTHMVLRQAATYTPM